jgi:hypothetical protein
MTTKPMKLKLSTRTAVGPLRAERGQRKRSGKSSGINKSSGKSMDSRAE